MPTINEDAVTSTGDTTAFENVDGVRAGTSGGYTAVTNNGAGTTIAGTYGTLNIKKDGTYTYTLDHTKTNPLDAGDTVIDTFQYQGSFTGNGNNLQFTITGLNDAPVASNDTATTNEDTAVVIDVRANDSDPDDALGTPILVSNASHGNVTLSNGKFTYTPTGNYNGTDSFTYKLNDGTVDSGVATVSVTVTPVDDAPTGASPTTLTAINENSGPRTITLAELLGTLADVDGALSVTNLQKVGGGTLTGSSPTWTYTPATNDSSSVTFTYTITGGGNNIAKSVTMDLVPVNSAPTDITLDNASVAENATGALVGKLSATDAQGGAMTYTIKDANSPFEIVSGNELHVKAGTSLNYEALSSYTVKIEAKDSGGLAFTKDLGVTVTDVNEAPIANPDSYTTNEDTALSVPFNLGLKANDSDPDAGDTINVAFGTPSHGTLSGQNGSGSFTYTPDANWSGTDTFTYFVYDKNNVQSAPATVTITVNSVNDAPTTSPNALTANATEDGSAVTINGLSGAADVDGDTLTVLAPGILPAGVTFDAGSNSFSLDPKNAAFQSLGAGKTQTVSVNYTISDGHGGSVPQTATWTVTGVDDPAVAHDDTFTVDEDQVLTVTAGNNVFLNDVDVDGDPIVALSNTNPGHGTVTNTNGQAGTFTYTPDANFHGTDTLTYTLSSGSVGTITITVNSVNDVPLVDQTIANVSGTEDTAVNFTIAANAFKDADGDSLTYSATLSDDTALPSWLHFDAATRTFSGTPDANYNGSLSIKVTATDGVVGTTPASQTFALNIAAVNDAPTVAAPLTATATEDGATVSISALQGATDVDGDTLTVTSVGTLPAGVTFDGASTFTLDPANTAYQSLAQGETKTVTVTYKVSDGLKTVDQTASWTITGTNDVPVAVNDTYTIAEDSFYSEPGPGHFANDLDPDQGDFNFQGALVQGPQHGTLTPLGAPGGLVYTPFANYNGEDSFTYTITDSKGATSNVATVKFVITAVNDAPTVTGTLTAAATEDSGVSTVSAISNASDIDGDSLSVVEYGNLPAGVTYDPNSKSFKLDTNNAAFQSLKAGATTDVIVNYKVSDGTLKTADSIKWTVTGVNDAPTAVALNGQVAINENSAAGTVVGTLATTDVDVGDTVSYTVTSNGSNFEVVNGQLVVKAGAVLNYEAGSTQSVTVRATDGSGATKDQVFTVTLKDVNEAPSVTLKSSYTATEQTNLTIDSATASVTDPENSGVYTAVLSVGHGTLDVTRGNSGLTSGDVVGDGTGTVTITGSLAEINAVLKGSGSAGLTYYSASDNPPASTTLTVTVTDNGNPGGGTKLSGSATSTINITPVNDAPVLVGGASQTFSIDENGPVGATITTVHANDPDNATLTYTLSGKDSGKFFLDTTTGVLKLINPGDYETDSSYSVTVTASDGKLSDSQAITVNIKDVNEAPTSFSFGNAVTTRAENSLTVPEQFFGVKLADINIVDDAKGTNSISLSGADAKYFEVVNGDLRLKAGVDLDYEAKSTYAVTVSVKDSTVAGSSTLIKDFVFSVTDVNEAPTITSNASVSVNENQTAVLTVTSSDPDAGDTKTYSIVGGNEASKFDINASTGVVTFKSAPDYETPGDNNHNNKYTLDVKVTDSKGKSDTQSLTVTVKDVNEAPTALNFSNTTTTRDEGTAGASEKLANLSTTDDALGTETYSIVSGADSDYFEIRNGNELYLKSGKILDYEGKTSLTVTVSAKDLSLPNSTAVTKDFTLTLKDVNDNTPSITSAATFTVFENNGTTVGTVTATDADVTPAFKTITYSISGGADAALFNIDGATGALKLNAAADFEAKSTYNLTVKASDGTLSSTQDVTVKVTDVNEAPTAADVSATVAENVAAGTVLATVVGSDPDTGGGNDALNDYENLNYSITGGNAGGLFTIDAVSGQVKLAAGKALDFEAAGSHVLTVTTTDGGGLTKTSTVTINVTDVNEAPTTADLAPVTFAESTAAGTVLATVIGSDPDTGGGNDALNTFENLSYSITGGNAGGLFAIDATTGVVTLAAGKALDYETATSHVLTVTTTDGGGLTKTSTVTINVTDVNDVAPVFTLAGLQTPGGTFSVNAEENVATTTTVLDAAATDGDVTPAFKVITYSLSGDDAGKFDISSTGKVTFKASPNFDIAGDANANNIYAITVTASDGVHTTSKDVAIQLTDVNDITPQITSGATATVAENSVGAVYTATAVDTDLTPAFRNITYSLAAGGDNDLFNINGVTGVVTFKASPNFEAPLDSDKNNSYVLTVRASDGVNVGTKTVTVNVTDLVEDSGPANTAGLAITSTNATINDNTPLILGVASSTLAGQTVTLFEGTTQRGTGVIQANGSWSIESSNVGADGAHSFTAQLGSSISNSVTLTIDTVAPVVAITGTTGTGFSPSVNGTASVADVGRTVTLFDGSTAVGTGTVGTGGAFSVTALLTGTGPHSLTASVTDLAGNVGTSAATAYTIAPQPAQGQIDGDNLKIAYQNIMDGPASSQTEGAYLQDLVSKLSLNLMTYKEALDAVIDHADGTTSVATLSYQFFTGKIPTKAGLDYLVSTTGGNANNINSAYYQDFNIENRYINFAVNLGHDGAGKDAFQTKYGALTLFDATKKAYAEIFGATPTDAKVHELLDTTFSFGGKTITRADYFASYGHDAIGTKAAMVGWLLSEAVKADVGTYATANEAFLSDLADGATFNVDLIGTYGSKAIPLEVLG